MTTATTPATAGATPDALHELTVVVRALLDCPVSLVSLLDGERLRWLASSPVPTPAVDTTDLGTASVVEPTVFCRRVIATGRPLQVHDTVTDPEVVDGDLQRGDTLADLGARAYCGIPLTVGDAGVVGALVALDVEPRTWTPAEVAVLTRLGVLASAALGLHEASTEATRSRAAAESATTQARCCWPCPRRWPAPRPRRHRLRRLRRRRQHPGRQLLLPGPGGPRPAAVGVRPRPRSPRPAGPAVGLGAPRGRPPRRPRRRHRAGDLVPRRGAMLVRHPTTWDPATGPIPYEATAHLPLSHAGQVVGVLSLVFDSPRSWTRSARDEKLALARYTAQALHRAQLLADRRTAARPCSWPC